LIPTIPTTTTVFHIIIIIVEKHLPSPLHYPNNSQKQYGRTGFLKKILSLVTTTRNIIGKTQQITLMETKYKRMWLGLYQITICHINFPSDIPRRAAAACQAYFIGDKRIWVINIGKRDNAERLFLLLLRGDTRGPRRLLSLLRGTAAAEEYVLLPRNSTRNRQTGNKDPSARCEITRIARLFDKFHFENGLPPFYVRVRT